MDPPLPSLPPWQAIVGLAVVIGYLARGLMKLLEARKPSGDLTDQFAALSLRITGLEREMEDLTRVHRDPESPFATVHVLEGQREMGKSLLTIELQLKEILRKLP